MYLFVILAIVLLCVRAWSLLPGQHRVVLTFICVEYVLPSTSFTLPFMLHLRKLLLDICQNVPMLFAEIKHFSHCQTLSSVIMVREQGLSGSLHYCSFFLTGITL